MSFDPRLFDRDGQPLTIEQWCQLLTDDDYRRVAFTRVGLHEVSTVWLGLDHIFETMTFPDSQMCDRYSTEAAARQGHEDMVTLLRATQPRRRTDPKREG